MLEIINANMPEIIALLSTAITALFGWVGKVIVKILKEKRQDEEMHHIINNVVKYVEQKAKTGGNMKNEEKKALAMDKAQEWLTSKGIKVSDVELEILIEAAVQGLRGGLNV